MIIFNYTGSPGEIIPQKVLGGYFFWLTLYVTSRVYVTASSAVCWLSGATGDRSVSRSGHQDTYIILWRAQRRRTVERENVPHTWCRKIDLLPELQSAYHARHSVETAVLKPQALDIVDLSAVFDTVDHAILLWRLGGGMHDNARWKMRYVVS